MKERPILFSGDMVRAILDGRKTQTRRVIKPQPDDNSRIDIGEIGSSKGVAYVRGQTGGQCVRLPCPYGQPGDRLWVRETWARYNIDQDSHDMAYKASIPDDWPIDGRWRPSIHMPRWASRITLEITNVRVERLQDIAEEDAKAEGVRQEKMFGYYISHEKSHPCRFAKTAFKELWSSIYHSWDENPWVWVVEFNLCRED